LNRDSIAITAMIKSGSIPIMWPSRYAVATRLRVASTETRYRFASEAAIASISERASREAATSPRLDEAFSSCRSVALGAGGVAEKLRVGWGVRNGAPRW
jgi:hypothetical protein